MAPDADATAGPPQGWHDLEAVLAEEPVARLLAAYLASGTAHPPAAPSAPAAPPGRAGGAPAPASPARSGAARPWRCRPTVETMATPGPDTFTSGPKQLNFAGKTPLAPMVFGTSAWAW